MNVYISKDSQPRSIISLPEGLWKIKVDMEWHDWYRWKVARKNSKLSPSASTRTISKWILIVSGWWVTVYNCVRRKRISMIRASNLPCLPWNITSEVYQIRTTLKRRSNFSCVHRETVASTKRENPSLESGSGNSSSNQSFVDASENEVHSNQERNPSRGQNLDYNFWMTDVQKTLLRHSHLQVHMVRHHDEYER